MHTITTTFSPKSPRKPARIKAVCSKGELTNDTAFLFDMDSILENQQNGTRDIGMEFAQAHINAAYRLMADIVCIEHANGKYDKSENPMNCRIQTSIKLPSGNEWIHILKGSDPLTISHPLPSKGQNLGQLNYLKDLD